MELSYIPASLCSAVLSRENHTCQMCGETAGTVGFLTEPVLSSNLSQENLRALCADCAEGLDGILPIQRPTRIEVLSFVRRATVEDQREVMKWLQVHLAKYCA